MRCGCSAKSGRRLEGREGRERREEMQLMPPIPRKPLHLLWNHIPRKAQQARILVLFYLSEQHSPLSNSRR